MAKELRGRRTSCPDCPFSILKIVQKKSEPRSSATELGWATKLNRDRKYDASLSFSHPFLGLSRCGMNMHLRFSKQNTVFTRLGVAQHCEMGFSRVNEFY